MMIRNKKLLLLAATAMIVTLPFAKAFAVTSNVEGHALFRVAITLTPTLMEFGNIDYVTVPLVGADTVDLGSDSTIAYNGTFTDGTGGSAPTAGTVTVDTGTVGAVVEVRCDATAHMTEPGGESIDIVAIDVIDDNVDTGGLGFGLGAPCVGVGGAAALTMTLGAGAATDMVRLGGRIDGATASGAWNGGDFSTTNAGGIPAQVDIMYQ